MLKRGVTFVGSLLWKVVNTVKNIKNTWRKDMPKLILCRGIQGSGKTTWAKQYCKEHPNTIRVNRDDIRQMFS